MDYNERFQKEITYYWNDTDLVFVRSVPGKGYFVKYPGKQEFKADYALPVVFNAVWPANEISKTDYIQENRKAQ